MWVAESFFAGVPVERLVETVEPLRQGREVVWRDLGAELQMLPLVAARHRGLSPEAAQEVEEQDGERRRVLSVVRLTAGTPSAELLRAGDLLLRVNDRLPLDFQDVERAAQAEQVRVSALRSGRERALEISTTVLDGRGTDRVLLWAGALLQHPHHALAAQRGLVPDGLYVSWFWYGSPANRYGIRATRRIVAVDGVPVHDLDDFLAAVSGLPDRSSLRLHTLDLDDRPGVVTLKLDLEFWPTVELRRTAEGWQRIPR